MMIFPFALVLMYGRMLRRMRHAYVIFSVMLVLMAGTIVWAVYYDTLKPNPGLTGHAVARTYEIPSAAAPGGKQTVNLPAVPSLPVDQHLGNLEGKEMRFGTSAGATFDALTTDVTCGAVNAEEDSLNPLAALSPMVGMWLNCIYGGKGVGMINLLL
jgi:K+-transporting ATPase ATPase A chain